MLTGCFQGAAASTPVLEKMTQVRGLGKNTNQWTDLLVGVLQTPGWLPSGAVCFWLRPLRVTSLVCKPPFTYCTPSLYPGGVTFAGNLLCRQNTTQPFWNELTAYTQAFPGVKVIVMTLIDISGVTDRLKVPGSHTSINRLHVLMSDMWLAGRLYFLPCLLPQGNIFASKLLRQYSFMVMNLVKSSETKLPASELFYLLAVWLWEESLHLFVTHV